MVDKYTKVLKECYFKAISENKAKAGTGLIGVTFKSEDRNPFLRDNEPVEKSEFSDIWEKISGGINDFKSKIFWF